MQERQPMDCRGCYERQVRRIAEFCELGAGALDAMLVVKDEVLAGYGDERQLFVKFFDKRSFAIMAVMMTGGIAIRSIHLLPDVFIAVFYTGLGTALAFAGDLFDSNLFRDRGGA